ncbi:MAG: hypothetical protein IJ424_04850 [Oscillospiraceae bacterium]|nr:hypothetical protein [Oscillospiraceae bacterium]
MKKILTFVLALTMTLALAVSASAFSGSADVALHFGNDVNWVTVASEAVTIDGPGEYTFTLTDVNRDAFNMTVLYIKDVAVEAQEATVSNLPSDIEIITKSLKINGEEIALDEGYPTTLNENGVFDVCYYNIWATSYFKTLGMEIINDIEVVIEIKGGEAEAPAADEAPADEAPADEAPADTTEDAPADDATEAPVDDEAPADTGLAFAVIPAVVALAAAVLSKKR